MNIDEEIKQLIIDAIIAYNEGKNENKNINEKRDYTEIGKIIAKIDSIKYTVALDNAEITIPASNYNIQTYQANDIVYITIPCENYSNKFISGLKYRPS